MSKSQPAAKTISAGRKCRENNRYLDGLCEGLRRRAEEIDRLRVALAEQDHFILRFTDAARNGDWACAECKPHSDMIKAGFQCGWHRALARNPLT